MTTAWKLGTRGSELAQAQSRWVAERLTEASGRPVELVVISTKGDQVRDRPLSEVGGKGLFTKEIEDAMIRGDVDFAVHSMKDMPTEGPPGLVIAGIPEREDPRDVLIGGTLEDLPHHALVGTGSARRKMQIQALRPDLIVRGIRGNVGTRIGKQQDGTYDAVVLAAAGMRRLGLDVPATPIDAAAMVPAVGQGALAIQCREDDADLRAALEGLTDPDTAVAIGLERAFLIALSGGCSVPAGCHARVDRDRLVARAFYGREDGAWVSEAGTCAREDGAQVGRELAERLIARLAQQPPRADDEGTARRP